MITEVEAAYLFDLFRAARRGSFANAYAAYEKAATPALGGRFHIEIGAELERAMSRRGSGGLRKLIGSVLRQKKIRAITGPLIEALDSLAVRREATARTGCLPDDLRLARAFGTFVCFAAACRCNGSYADIDSLAAMTARVCRPEGTSATDVKRVVREYTTTIPLAAWIDAAGPMGK